MPRPPPSSTLFPYTTLFRSRVLLDQAEARALLGHDEQSPEERAVCDRARDAHVERFLELDPLRNLHQQAVLPHRSEEHTSELQSRRDLVCRLLLEKKKKKN